jgi:DNA (cytosine-5)-methyltransferase 1
MASAGTKLWLGNQEALTGDYHVLQPTGAFGKDVSDTVTSKFSKGAELLQQGAQNGGNCVLHPIALAENTIGRQPKNGGNGDGFTVGGPMYTLNCSGVHGVAQPIGFPANLSGTQCATTENLSPSLGAKNPTGLVHHMAVRRLTPVECERLQGFPDGYTNIPWRKKDESPDGPRYKALGNSWAVPVARWIGQRINMLEGI